MTAITLVRLVNGSTAYEGIVEVYRYGEWGTICNDEWDLNDAEVVCREIGFGPAIDAKNEVFYGQSSTQACFSDFSCTGEETTIRECSFNKLEIISHLNEVAGVKCAASKGINFICMYICVYSAC